MADYAPNEYPDETVALLGDIATAELRPSNNNFDELVAHNMTVHFEMMSDGVLWCALYPDEGGPQTQITLWISAKKSKLQIVISDED